MDRQMIQHFGRLAGIAGLLLALGLLASGCSGTNPAKPEAGKPGESAKAPTITLVAPVAGAKVAPGVVDVKVETSGLKFVMPSNTNVTGEGHVHFTLDDRPFVMSTTPGAVIKDVAPGTHRLVAELVQNDTEPFDPPVKQEIEFVAE